jgi:protein SCO1/2
MRIAALSALAAAAVACAGCGGTNGPAASTFNGTLFSPPRAAPAFTLHDQAGHASGLSAAPGHYVIVTFLYTHCPDVCPVIAGKLNTVLKSATARRAGLEVLAVSVDPKRDTPAAVRTFVHDHQLVPAFRYLTGTRAELAPVWKGFEVAAIAGPKGTVTHSSFEILIDPAGKERLIYDRTVIPAAIIHDLEALQRGA